MMQLMRVGPWSWSWGELLIAVVILAACVGIAYVALKQFGVPIPQWAFQVMWIVLVAVVAVFAIRLVLSL